MGARAAGADALDQRGDLRGQRGRTAGCNRAPRQHAVRAPRERAGGAGGSRTEKVQEGAEQRARFAALMRHVSF